MSFCTVHNAPAGPRGCVHCQRDERLMRSHESRRFWRGVAFVGVPFLAALALGAWFVSQRPSRRDARLDARAYREAIENIEGGLYTTERLGYETADLMRQGLRQLPLDLRKTIPSPAQRRALDGLERFCIMTAAMAEDDGFDVVPARQEWERLRATYFQPAPWFRASSAALEQAQQSGEARGIPGDAAQYQATLDQLRLAAARAEVALQDAARAEYDESYGGDAGHRWVSAQTDLKREMENIRQQAPVEFPGMDPGWRRAHTELEKAMRVVGGLLINAGTHRGARARIAIDAAEAALKAAQR
jgi:hypothetical protein